MKTITIALCVLAAGLGSYAAGSREAKADRFFELRTYTPSPGKMDALLARFRDHTLKLFEKHGMTNIGYWVTADGKLVYVLAFPSQDARAASFKAFGADPDWQKVYADSQKDGVKLASKVESVFLTPADFSAIK